MNRTNRAVISATIASGASAYSAGDQVGVATQLSGAADVETATQLVVSLTVVDKAGQTAAMDVFLFSLQPTITSADNDVPAISTSEMASKCLGVITVANTDFKAMGTGATVATVKNQLMCVKPGKISAPTGSTSLWALVVTRGTPTYTASCLTIRLGVER